MDSSLMPINLWQFVDKNKELLKPPVNNIVVWKGAGLLFMIIGGPNKRRDFHRNPSEEIFYQLKGECYIETINAEGKRKRITIKEGEIFHLPANILHSPHRSADSIGVVIEQNRLNNESEYFVWFCEQCNHELHHVYIQLTDIEVQLEEVISSFNNNLEQRTCRNCGYVMLPE